MRNKTIRVWLFILSFTPAMVFAEGGVMAASPSLYSEAVRADLASTANGKGAGLIGYMPQGVSAVAETVQSKLREQVSVKDFGAVCNGVADDTVTIQNAINATSSTGAALYVPPGVCRGNWTLKSDTTIIGSSQNTTIFKPALNAPVFFVSPTSSTVRVRLERFGINGDRTMNAQDGISLNPVAASTFVDTVYIDSVWILNSGKNGIYTHGTSSAGPFVQTLRINHVFIAGSVQEGLYMDGEAFESMFTDLWAYNNGTNTIPNVTLGSKTRAGSSVSRVTWIGGGATQAAVVASSRYISDLVTTAGSATATSTTANFTAADVGKYIAIHNGNTYRHPLITTIQSVKNTTTAVLSAVANVANTGGTNAIVNLAIGGAINVQHAKQIKLIGLDFENAGVYVVVSGTLQQNLSIDNCNFGSTKPVLATVWAQGGGDGLEVRNSNTSNTALHFYNLLSSDATGAALGIANQIKNIDFQPTANPPVLAHLVMFDNQNVTPNMTIYQRNIGFIRINGSGTVNKLLDLSGGTASFLRGQRMTLFANNNLTINHHTTASGNIYTKTGANVTLAAGASMTLQWDDLSGASGLWFER